MNKDLLFAFADGRQMLVPYPTLETLARVARLEAAAQANGPETAIAFLARLARVAEIFVETARWKTAPIAKFAEHSTAVRAEELTLREARQIVNACTAQVQGRDPAEKVKAGEAESFAATYPALQNLTLQQIAELAKAADSTKPS